MINISIGTFFMISILFWYIIYSICTKIKLNKFWYYFTNILVFGMIPLYTIFFNKKSLTWLNIDNLDQEFVPIAVFIIILAYIYMFAWVLPRNREK